MYKLNLTLDQFVLVVSSLEIAHDLDLESVGYYSSPEHYDKEELEISLEEVAKITALLQYLKEGVEVDPEN